MNVNIVLVNINLHIHSIDSWHDSSISKCLSGKLEANTNADLVNIDVSMTCGNEDPFFGVERAGVELG